MNSENIVCWQNFDKKIFGPPKAQGSPWGVIFSMVEIFSCFVLLLMGTPYAHRIYS